MEKGRGRKIEGCHQGGNGKEKLIAVGSALMGRPRSGGFVPILN